MGTSHAVATDRVFLSGSYVELHIMNSVLSVVPEGIADKTN
jgi:hypothetical protein